MKTGMNDKGKGNTKSRQASVHPVARNVKPKAALRNRAQARRRLGWQAGLVLSAGTLALLLAPGQEHLHAPGTMNVGHESLACESCHTPAPGSVRQQLQANARYLLGLRSSAADFGNRDVTNRDCLSCHERPFDRHPVFRFNEPRFEEARQKLGAHECQSCHGEHTGQKVIVEATYCVTCHADLTMENDPLDVPHSRLVEHERWDTCLGCHDFHGNHQRTTQRKLNQAIAPTRIHQYFQGGESPYGSNLRAPALTERKDVSKE